jgi:hypothetical protein
MISANQIIDHYFVALARHRLKLATFDEPLASTFAKDSDLVQLIRQFPHC